jgi:hypothetical protein
MQTIHILCAILVASVSSQLVLPNLNGRRAAELIDQQKPVMGSDSALPLSNQDNPPVGTGNDDVILSDVLGKERSIGIFAGFTRDIEGIAKRFSASGSNSTVLAPINSAITSLPRKPWEDPEDYKSLGADAYEGELGEDRAHRNLRRFVESHIVPVVPWEQGKKVKTVAGQEIWWESEDGKKLVSSYVT